MIRTFQTAWKRTHTIAGVTVSLLPEHINRCSRCLVVWCLIIIVICNWSLDVASSPMWRKIYIIVKRVCFLLCVQWQNVCSFDSSFVRPSGNEIYAITARKHSDRLDWRLSYPLNTFRIIRLGIANGWISERKLFQSYARWQGRSSVNLQPNRQRPWSSVSRSKFRIEYIGKFIRVKRSVFVDTAETERKDYTNRRDVKACQEKRWTIPVAKTCQGVLAYDF